jgi:hypothetical protein
MTVNFVDPAKAASALPLYAPRQRRSTPQGSALPIWSGVNIHRCLLADCSDTKCHDRKATEQALAEFIIEFANALAVIHHGYPCVGAKQLLRPLR